MSEAREPASTVEKANMGKLEKPLPKPAYGRAEVDGDEGDEDKEHNNVDDPV